MNLALIAHFIKRTIQSSKSALWLNALTVATIALAMLILSIFLLMFHNVARILSLEEARIGISVYLSDDISKERRQIVMEVIESSEVAEGVKYLSKADALRLFRGWNRKLGPLVDKVGRNPFPASFEIQIKEDLKEPKVGALVDKLASLPGVENVDYSREWFAKLKSFVRVLEGTGIFMLAFLSLAAVFLVSNTIRLNIYSRRDEIEIMRLVGATDFFIRTPFLLEGFSQGLFGSLLAIVLLLATYKITNLCFGDSLNNLLSGGLVFLPMDYLWIILILGVLVGLAGSGFAVRRFLRGEL